MILCKDFQLDMIEVGFRFTSWYCVFSLRNLLGLSKPSGQLNKELLEQLPLKYKLSRSVPRLQSSKQDFSIAWGHLWYLCLQIACQEAINNQLYDVAQEALLKLHAEVVQEQSKATGLDSPLKCMASESLILRSLIRCTLESKGSLTSEDVGGDQGKNVHEEIAKYCQLAAGRLEDIGYAKFSKENEVGMNNIAIELFRTSDTLWKSRHLKLFFSTYNRAKKHKIWNGWQTHPGMQHWKLER